MGKMLSSAISQLGEELIEKHRKQGSESAFKNPVGPWTRNKDFLGCRMNSRIKIWFLYIFEQMKKQWKLLKRITNPDVCKLGGGRRNC